MQKIAFFLTYLKMAILTPTADKPTLLMVIIFIPETFHFMIFLLKVANFLSSRSAVTDCHEVLFHRSSWSADLLIAVKCWFTDCREVLFHRLSWSADLLIVVKCWFSDCREVLIYWSSWSAISPIVVKCCWLSWSAADCREVLILWLSWSTVLQQPPQHVFPIVDLLSAGKNQCN